MKIRHAAALAFGLSLIGAASQAQTMGNSPAPGSIYLRVEGGWNTMDNLSASGAGIGFPISASMSDGYIAGGALGYNVGPFLFGGNFRVELGLDYRSNDISRVRAGGVALAGSTGSVDNLAGMVNGIVDLPIDLGGIKPYLGAGAGFASVSLSHVGAAGFLLSNDTDTVPAIQGIAGAKYDLTPNWAVGVEYRFLAGFNMRFHSPVLATDFSTSDYHSHSVLASITYTFAPPPPPPPPVQPAAAPMPAPPPPPPAATVPPGQFFIVFFDFDKSVITDAGRQVLDAAADAYMKNHPVRIELTGYTDTVGTQQYNLGLSKRRAQAVADYLAKKGVPRKVMDVAWKGKEDLRVPTPDGVREPQNRRVEIVIPQ